MYDFILNISELISCIKVLYYYRNIWFNIVAILNKILLRIFCDTNGKMAFFDNVSIAAILSGILKYCM